MNKYITSEKIRELFLNFFKNNNHTILPSSSLIPNNDNSLLFTNAGMVQFKNFFLGNEISPYKNIVTSQKCIRISGKHNDIENIGYTKRHHTFFEMLGNFSIGGYSKKKAILLSWEFITKILYISPKNIWITVYNNDKESLNIWKNIVKINENNIILLKENFWFMGNSGPCGPCTEIFYSFSQEKNDLKEENSIFFNNLLKKEKCIEIWNIVFIEFNKDIKGDLHKLKTLCIDTGMGLERISSIMQNCNSNYDTDIFRNIIDIICKNANIQNRAQYKKHLTIISDHIRAIIFLINDGQNPSNIGRGYALRKIIRRTIKHLIDININSPFLYKLVDPIALYSKKYFSDVYHNRAIIKNIIYKEEYNFFKIIKEGLIILKKMLKDTNHLSGNKIFALHDTHGFPIDLIIQIAKERNITLDMKKYYFLMKQQKIKSKEKDIFFFNNINNIIAINCISPTIFLDYKYNKNKYSIITHIILDDSLIAKTFNKEKKYIIILNKTIFYGESGGQIGDSGKIVSQDNIFCVEETKKIGKIFLHYGYIESGYFSVNDNVFLSIDIQKREKISCNHSATHILHQSLRKVLGNSLIQKSSLVTDKYLRFDFSYNKKITNQEIQDVEEIANNIIKKNIEIKSQNMKFYDAKKTGAISLFNEKYSDIVRVLNIGNFSKEFCGGTHAQNTNNIIYIKIISQSPVGSGIRRIEAKTGKELIYYLNNINQKNNILLHEKDNKIKYLEKKNKILQEKILLNIILIIKRNIFIKNNIYFLIENIKNIEFSSMKYIINYFIKNFFKNKIYFIFLSSYKNKKSQYIIIQSSKENSFIDCKVVFNYIKNKYPYFIGGGTSYIVQMINKNKFYKDFLTVEKDNIIKIILLQEKK